jgi:hypothetical protein
MEEVTSKMANLKITDSNNDLPAVEAIPHVYEKIFALLDKKSLFSCLLVSSQWNHVIVKSPKLMEKLELIIDLTGGEFLGSDILGTSNRHFNSVKIKHYAEKNVEFESFLKLHKWNSLKLNSQFIAFPDLRGSSLDKLTVLEVTTLKLSNVLNLIQASVNLKELKLVVTHCVPNDWKKLTENCSVTMRLDKLKLNLYKLKVTLCPYLPFAARRVNRFLATQMQNLTDLEIQGIIINANTLKIISNMSKLKVLTVQKSFYAVQEENLELGLMQSLKTLNIYDDLLIDSRVFVPIVKVAKNVTKIEVQRYSQTRIEITGGMENLEEIYVESLELNNFGNPEMFPKLKFIKVKKPIPKNQQEEIAKQVQRDFTNFKLCLYEEVAKRPHSDVLDVDLNLN